MKMEIQVLKATTIEAIGHAVWNAIEDMQRAGIARSCTERTSFRALDLSIKTVKNGTLELRATFHSTPPMEPEELPAELWEEIEVGQPDDYGLSVSE